MIDSSTRGRGCTAAKPRREKKHERPARVSEIRAALRKRCFHDARRGLPLVQPRPHNSAPTHLYEPARPTGGRP